MPNTSMLIKHPLFLRVCWLFEISVSTAAPILALVHYEAGRPTHGIFWMLVAIWAGRGAHARYLALLLNDPKAEPTTVVVRNPSPDA